MVLGSAAKANNMPCNQYEHVMNSLTPPTLRRASLPELHTPPGHSALFHPPRLVLRRGLEAGDDDGHRLAPHGGQVGEARVLHLAARGSEPKSCEGWLGRVGALGIG